VLEELEMNFQNSLMEQEEETDSQIPLELEPEGPHY